MDKPSSLNDPQLGWHRLVKHTVDRTLGRDLTLLLFPNKTESGNDGWEVSHGRAPYTDSIRNPETGAVAFVHPELSHVLIELPGRACAWLERWDNLDGIIRRTSDRATRIDVTADIACNVYPSDFAIDREGLQSAATNVVSSNTGNSYYIGAPTSDRRAVIYRFCDPHPRAGFLRVEHRARRDAAKVVASYYAKFGLKKTLLAVAWPYRWRHPSWQPEEMTFEPMPAYTSKERQGGKLLWVINQVLPALRKYEQDGTIPDLRQFLEDYLFIDDADDPIYHA